MKNENILKYYSDDEDMYILEYTESSILPKKYAEEEFNNINMMLVDNAKLYKLVNGKPILVKEK